MPQVEGNVEGIGKASYHLAGNFPAFHFGSGNLGSSGASKLAVAVQLLGKYGASHPIYGLPEFEAHQNGHNQVEEATDAAVSSSFVRVRCLAPAMPSSDGR